MDNPIAFVKAKVEYVNCRATSPRKLDIHGAFSVCAKVLEHVPQDILCDIEGDDIQQMKSEIEASNIAGMTQEAFSVSEVLEISSGKQAAETIIRSDCSITMDDMKVLDNKLILQGEVIVKILYSSGMGETLPEHMEYTIPYSQMIDCAGLQNSVCATCVWKQWGPMFKSKRTQQEKICCLKQRYGQWLM